MLSTQDINARNVIIVNALDCKKFNMSLGNIVISDETSGEVLTKLSCYKVFALFVIGHITITSHVLENLSKYGINLVMLKSNFRPFFTLGGMAEANYLLRERQYHFEENLLVAQRLLKNKAYNQISVLKNIRNKNQLQLLAIKRCEELLLQFDELEKYELAELMGIEGNISKIYFPAVFDYADWNGRKPRAKLDPYNVVLDIGYTFLFNFVECFVKLFGFDVYYGVCHKTWFKRKSLICDLVEPFRCIIDLQARKAWNLKQFKFEHFTLQRGQYTLKKDFNKVYTEVFFNELVEHKELIFSYIRNYYRCFMGRKSVPHYPWFNFIGGAVEDVDS